MNAPNYTQAAIDCATNDRDSFRSDNPDTVRFALEAALCLCPTFEKHVPGFTTAAYLAFITAPKTANEGSFTLPLPADTRYDALLEEHGIPAE